MYMMQVSYTDERNKFSRLAKQILEDISCNNIHNINFGSVSFIKTPLYSRANVVTEFLSTLASQIPVHYIPELGNLVLRKPLFPTWELPSLVNS